MAKKKVLFLCTHNSARSQMAEGIMNRFHGDRFEAYSAGTEPTRVNPYAVEAMAEIGVDISENRSKNVSEFLNQEFDYVVSVCDKAAKSCAFFPGGEQVKKSFPDPSKFSGSREEKLASFRRLRDGISSWIDDFFA
jgi:arsenate reductase